ncbi:MAG: DEAD/DEAH box helicase [Clostridiales bacterium]|jgi:ATP-dependent RNA helicase DeaD|nr:DEAD/DEAH box helicase [Clostridiales bacterium]
MNDEMTFADLDLSPEVMDALKKMGVKRPTTIQQKAIPLLMDNFSVIAKAPTGTGKTFAFGIPILEYLNLDSKLVQALILCPTRELALQITTELKGLAKYIKGFRVTALIGGQSMRLQSEKLQKKPQVIVATPGRLIDMTQRKLVDISNIYTLVLDEADEMLKMGFINDIRTIMAMTPKDKQIALFSATMPREIQNITWEFMSGSAEIDVMPKAEDHPDIDEYIVECPEKDKLKTIIRIMAKEDLRKTIVFCNTKMQTSKVGQQLTAAGVSAGVLHGDCSQRERNRVMDFYRAGKFDVLVATDVVARGIDVDDIEAVFNYDIPKENELYLHRIGRTARAGKSGKAFSLVAYLDRPRMEEIIRYTKIDPKPYEI